MASLNKTIAFIGKEWSKIGTDADTDPDTQREGYVR